LAPYAGYSANLLHPSDVYVPTAFKKMNGKVSVIFNPHKKSGIKKRHRVPPG
jgi:hypothetical protein